MSFNAEQREHMQALAAIAPDQRCWCGWYRIGMCPHCPAGRTAAEKIARRQSCCGYTPSHPDLPDGHFAGCKQQGER